MSIEEFEELGIKEGVEAIFGAFDTKADFVVKVDYFPDSGIYPDADIFTIAVNQGGIWGQISVTIEFYMDSPEQKLSLLCAQLRKGINDG